MKKNFAIVAVLAVALLGTLGLINKASAAPADITLAVHDGAFTCTLYPTAVDFGTTTGSATDTLLNQDNWTNSFTCTNYKSDRNTQLIAQSTDLTGSTSAANIIPASKITWVPVQANFTQTAGDCSDMAVGSGGTLDTAKDIITNLGTFVCDFTYIPVDNAGEMTVNVPAYTPVDTYKAVMTITDPS